MPLTRLLHLLPFLLLLGTLAGCTGLPQRSPALPESLEQAAMAYREAQSRLAGIAADDPQRARLERDLRSYRKEFEETAITLAHREERRDRLLAAVQLLERALTLAPSPRLQSLHDDLEARRLATLKRLDWEQDLARSRYLLDQRRLLQARSGAAAGETARQWRLRWIRWELEALSLKHRQCAESALATSQLAIAEACIRQAEAIRGTDFVAAQRRKLAARRKPRPAAARPAAATAAADNADETRRLRLQLRLALRQGDLPQARRLVEQLIARDGETAALLDLKAAIDNAIAARIGALRQQASELYSKQDYLRARARWQEILSLDPEDAEARGLLERVERVIHKLEQLQEQQSSEPTPPAAE
ncbi:hypothetical protein QVG61_03865 [Thiohalobacter sp. IOR34]|uniref:hypothetical protein n=1 Tax=Thiohalobacter sp. IOR34 TaxID=3057176 RepID=UPI0025AF76A3|nr:hypothetical protein [Thiohalobacter sp. IOR34]WJW76240.1 hypothetical protein QVG61_03865 [Thiohalobacter sp. IOR34]